MHCIGASVDSNTISIVMPLYDLNLKRFITTKKQDLNTYIKMKIALEMAKGLEYLHSLSVIHRDLKPENVMVSASCYALLT